MSSFEVAVRPLVVSPHPNADRLEVAQVHAYNSVVGKNQFKTGDLAIYIPEQSIVPADILEELGLVGKLAGPDKNRVKAVNLRGVLSQGICYRPTNWSEDLEYKGLWFDGSDLTEYLGITKWEPPVPAQLAGEVEPSRAHFFRTYQDIENIKRYPHILIPGERIIGTEKIHGACGIFGLVRRNGSATIEPVVSSKGLAGKGLVIKESPHNTYWKAAKEFRIFEALLDYLDRNDYDQCILYGEIVGVQDLMYGLPKGKLSFRAFDLYVPSKRAETIITPLNAEGRFLDHEEFTRFTIAHNVPAVPVLYQGAYTPEVVERVTSGKSTLADHIREGVVVKTMPTRYSPEIGRVVLKSVSPEYLTRQGGTEFN
jgi:RNA ligase (TIGR02306 family)